MRPTGWDRCFGYSLGCLGRMAQPSDPCPGGGYVVVILLWLTTTFQVQRYVFFLAPAAATRMRPVGTQLGPSCIRSAWRFESHSPWPCSTPSICALFMGGTDVRKHPRRGCARGGTSAGCDPGGLCLQWRHGPSGGNEFRFWDTLDHSPEPGCRSRYRRGADLSRPPQRPHSCHRLHPPSARGVGQVRGFPKACGRRSSKPATQPSRFIGRSWPAWRPHAPSSIHWSAG